MTNTYTAQYWNGSAYVELTNIVNIDLQFGRRKITDQWTPSSGTIVFRAPSFFSSPIAALVPGCLIRIKSGAAFGTMTTMYLSDLQSSYGIPYVGSQGQSDYVTMTLEGAFALWGRQQGNNFAVSAGLASTQLNAISTAAGLSMSYDYTGPYDVMMPASVVTGTYAEWISKFLITTGGRLFDIGPNIQLANKGNYQTGINLSDTTNDSTNKVYFAVDFASQVDNYFTQIEVDPDDFSPAIVQTGAKPYRSLKLSTFSVTSAQATDLANYYLAALSNNAIKPQSVSMSDAAQASHNLPLFYGYFWDIPFYFRGSFRHVFSVGGTVSVTPENMVMTLFLSGFENQNFLILNNATLGTLNYNRLGF